MRCVSLPPRAFLAEPNFAGEAGGWWPTQAVSWLEWGSSTAGQSVLAARSRLLPSTCTQSPVVLRALLRFVRENSVVPTGLESSVSLLPALKRWAKLGRPSGAGQVLRVHFVSGFATESAPLR